LLRKQRKTLGVHFFLLHPVHNMVSQDNKKVIVTSRVTAPGKHMARFELCQNVLLTMGH